MATVIKKERIRTLVLTADEYYKLAPNLNRRPNFILWERDNLLKGRT